MRPHRHYGASVNEFTTIDDLDPAARSRAVQLIQIQMGLPAEGNEALMACFEFALYAIASDRECFDELRLLHPAEVEQCPTCHTDIPCATRRSVDRAIAGRYSGE